MVDIVSRFLLSLLLLCVTCPLMAGPDVTLPRSGLQAEELALLINENDPVSVRIGEYYRQARHIPEENVLRVHLPADRAALSIADFTQLKQEIDRLTPERVQAYAVAWSQPYRVDCMSLTSALAFGFDAKFCARNCGPTAASPYFNSPSQHPFDEFRMRPAMMLAGTDFEAVRALIDRGVASDQTWPSGTAYLLDTSDAARSVRAATFPLAERALRNAFPVQIIKSDTLADRQDVMFYFTGLTTVGKLETLRFLPGALADHLTSFGGQLTDSRQMSSLRWLEAGATASYGTVVEPCNHLQKFPVPAVAMFHYLNGTTALEAYWKSVAWPGEGVFIGEPLARPFAPALSANFAGPYVLHAFAPQPGFWRAEHADQAEGPYDAMPGKIPLRAGKNQVRLNFPAATRPYVRLLR